MPSYCDCYECCAKRQHTCYDHCNPCKKTVNALCVKSKLQVKGCSSLEGTTQVDKLRFSDVGADSKRWCVQENANNMLQFDYEGQTGGARLRATKEGDVLPAGVIAESTESLAYAAGMGPAAVSTAVTSSFITIDAMAAGATLGDGVHVGQIKRVTIISDGGGVYTLTVPKLTATAALGGSPVSMGSAGDVCSATFQWTGTNWVWIASTN